MRRGAVLGLFFFTLVAFAQSALSEGIIRYRQPNGNTGFAQDPSGVPEGAEIIEPNKKPSQGAIQVYKTPPQQAKQNNARAKRMEEKYKGEEANKAVWVNRHKDRLAKVENAENMLKRSKRDASKACSGSNHSDSPYIKKEKRSASGACRTAKATREADEKRLQEAKTSLNNLKEECRKAGCLPGWVR